MEVVVGSRTKARERAGVSRSAGGFSSEKVGARRGEKKRRKKENESETVFDCVAFSLSRLFRNEYRQWPIQRRFFSSRLERGRISTSVRALPSSSPATPPAPSLVRSHLSWLNVTETRLQSVNITSSVLVSSCFLRTEFRCRLIKQKNSANRWSRNQV